jgi:hypothetical protein
MIFFMLPLSAWMESGQASPRRSQNSNTTQTLRLPDSRLLDKLAP